MNIRPLQDWVLIDRLEPVEKTSGGIIIPDTAKEKPEEGYVVAIGPGKFVAEKKKGQEKEKTAKKKFVPTILKPGQRVIFGKYSSRDFELDGKKITLVREEDILGIFEGETSLTIKKEHPVEVKHDNPPAVKKRGEVLVLSSKKEEKKTIAKSTAPAENKNAGKVTKTDRKPVKTVKKASVEANKKTRAETSDKTKSEVSKTTVAKPKKAVKKVKTPSIKSRVVSGKATPKKVKATGKSAAEKGQKQAVKAKKTGSSSKAVSSKKTQVKESVNNRKTAGKGAKKKTTRK